MCLDQHVYRRPGPDEAEVRQQDPTSDSAASFTITKCQHEKGGVTVDLVLPHQKPKIIVV